MPDIPDKKEYPCPNCGSTRRWLGELYKEEVAKGKANDDIPVGVAVNPAAVMDPRKSPLAVPVAIFIEDVCMDCGMKYVCQVNVKQNVPTTQMMSAGGKGPFGPDNLPPGFGG